MKRGILGVIMAFSCFMLRSQDIRDSIEKFSFCTFSYGFHIPSGDLADRFGLSSSVSLGFHHKTKRNFTFGGEIGFLFGNDVREDGILDSVISGTGFIIDQNGMLADVRLYERGMTWTFNAGKVFPVLGPNPNCGLWIMAGLGGIWHKIRIEDIGNRAPQLSGEYKKGYDRLSSGYDAYLFIGYLHFSAKKRVNFFAGFESHAAITKSRRSWNFDTMESDTRQRYDMLSGFRAGWILPLYKRTAKEIYYH